MKKIKSKYHAFASANRFRDILLDMCDKKDKIVRKEIKYINYYIKNNITDDDEKWLLRKYKKFLKRSLTC